MKRQAWTLTTPLDSDAFKWIDSIASTVQGKVQGIFKAGPLGNAVKNALHGTPVRHRLHPAVIIVPLGAWTTAALLDALDALAGDESTFQDSADISVAFGLIGVLPAVATGLADWVDTYGQQRRVGMTHALLNSAGVVLYATSMGLRLADQRAAARLLALAGYSLVGLSASVGGELVYKMGVNAPHALYPKTPSGWTEVLDSSELTEGQHKQIEFGRVPVLLLRSGGTVLATEAWCVHAGGPLNEGRFEGTCVTCPWHGAKFDLRDGRPLNGPATAPLRTFEVREENGTISLKPSYEGDNWPQAIS